MRDRDANIVGGVVFVILSLLSVSGSVSLGHFQTQNSSGSYLVYNPFLQVLAIIFSAVAMWFIYSAGKSTQSLSKLS